MCYPIIMKKFCIFFIFCFCAVFSYTQENLFKLENAQSSVYAKYIDGKEIFNKNSSWRLNAASVAKLFTTAAALDTFGPDYTFETKNDEQVKNLFVNLADKIAKMKEIYSENLKNGKRLNIEI